MMTIANNSKNNRLATVTEPDGRRTQYEYDPFGNRKRETITNIKNPAASGGSPKAYGDYRYEYAVASNRLDRVLYNNSVLESYTYDDAGRLMQRSHATNGLTSYTWDDRGLLLEAQTPAGTVSYTYDALGARLTKTANGVTTWYLSAPIFGLSHVLMELTPTSGIKASYVYAGNGLLKEELMQTDRSKDLYLLRDGMVGSVTHAIDQNGTIRNEYSYDAFGQRSANTYTYDVLGVRSTVASHPDSSRHHYGYTGEEQEAETGLIYLRARYYDPGLGRFISADPYWGRLEESVTQNRYIYVQNNPLMYTDPTGLATVDVTLAALYGGGGSVSARFDTKTGNLYVVPASGSGKDVGLSLGWSPDDYDGSARWVASGSFPVGSTGLSAGGDVTILNASNYQSSGTISSGDFEYSGAYSPVDNARYHAGSRIGFSIRYEQPMWSTNTYEKFNKLSDWFTDMNRKIDSFLRQCN